jgi:16S rRNA (uracil1498-N3)-methyltransferase
VERRDRASVATFFAEESLVPGAAIELPESGTHHVRVRRLNVGDALQVTNGRGSIAQGRIGRLTKSAVAVELEKVNEVPRPPTLRLFVPVADRERMLWLAEKSAELAVSSWHPVVFRRSASVSPRGEGEAFRRKVHARMVAALEQSSGGWLPEIVPELPLSDALVRADQDQRREQFLMERAAPVLVASRPTTADAMIGPEGGLEDDERALIIEKHGWLPASLGATTLRFETAGVLAAGILRALLSIE